MGTITRLAQFTSVGCMGLAMLMGLTAHAGPTLNSADLVVVGRNTDGDDEFGVVTLADIPGSSVLFITDEGWDDNDFTFDGSEDVFQWDVPVAGISAGTLIFFTNTSASTLALQSVSHGTLSHPNGSGDMSFLGGDQLFIYQTADDTYNGTIQRKDGSGGTEAGMIYAFNGDNATPSTYGWLDSPTPHAGSTSQAPDNMTVLSTSDGSGNAATANANGMLTQADVYDVNTDMLATGEFDNYAYNGPITATDKAGWLVRLHTTANWLADDSARMDLGDTNSTTATPSLQAAFMVQDPNVAPVITQGDGPLAVTMSEDGAPTAFVAPTLGATDSDGDTLTWSVSSAATNGTATVSGTGATPSTFTYVPNADYNGSDSFTIEVSDGNSGTDTIVVNVTVEAVNDAPVILDDYEFGGKWGSNGTGDGQFRLSQTDYIALDGAGNVYVGDFSNDRIQKFDANGSYLSQFDSSGSIDGPFRRVTGIAIDSNGNIYAGDRNNHRVQKFNSSGTFLLTWGSQGSGNGQFQSPEGIAVDSLDNVYVVDRSNHRVQKFNASGSFIAAWGGTTASSADGQFSTPYGVAVDASDNVYVCEDGNDRIQVFNTSGVFQRKWGSTGVEEGKFDAVRGVAVGGDGRIYTTDYNQHRVQVFTSDGTFVELWGTNGVSGTADGQFNRPVGIGLLTHGPCLCRGHLQQPCPVLRAWCVG